jgi:hypothetical protein
MAAARVIWTASGLPWPHYFSDLSGLGGSADESGTTVVVAICAKQAVPGGTPTPAGTSPGSSTASGSSATPAGATSASPSPTAAPAQLCAVPELVALNV